VPCSQTPAVARCQANAASSCCLPPAENRRRLPLLNSPFGVPSHGPHARCLRFAARVAPAPRKTRFRLVGQTFAGRDLHPLDPSEDFQIYIFLPSQVSWRTSAG